MTRRDYRRSIASQHPDFITLSASTLGKLGAEARREAKRKFHRELRASIGLPPAKALGG